MYKIQKINKHTLLLWHDNNNWDGTLHYVSLDVLNDTITEIKKVILSANQQPISIQQITDTVVAVCGYDGMLLWDITTQQCISHTLSKRIMLGAMYWDDTHILCWDIEGNMMLWDMLNAGVVKEFEGMVPSYYESGGSLPFLVLKEKEYLILWDVSLDVFDINTDQWLQAHESFPHAKGINSACLLYGDKNNHQTQHIIEKGQENKDNHKKSANQEATLPSKALYIVTCGNDHTIKIQTLDGGKITTLSGHENDVTGVMVLSDNRILSWSYDNTIRIWHADSANMLYLCKHHSVGVSQVWQLTENWVLSVDIFYNHIVWHIETGEIRHQFHERYLDALLLSSTCFITTSATGKMTVWNLHTGIKHLTYTLV